jgi:hypothetical protein
MVKSHLTLSRRSSRLFNESTMLFPLQLSLGELETI